MKILPFLSTTEGKTIDAENALLCGKVHDFIKVHVLIPQTYFAHAVHKSHLWHNYPGNVNRNSAPPVATELNPDRQTVESRRGMTHGKTTTEA